MTVSESTEVVPVELYRTPVPVAVAMVEPSAEYRFAKINSISDEDQPGSKEAATNMISLCSTELTIILHRSHESKDA